MYTAGTSMCNGLITHYIGYVTVPSTIHQPISWRCSDVHRQAGIDHFHNTE